MLYNFALRILEFFVLHNLRSIRRELIGHSRGKVLEIGLGTGQNLTFYQPGVDLTTIEPTPPTPAQLPQTSQLTAIQILSGSAEQLPFENDSFDCVVSTLVLCSIPNHKAALKEIHRVLKPEGLFLTLEHVRLEGFWGKLQDLLTPFWKLIAGGCHLNRVLEPELERVGFKTHERRVLWKGLGRYHILIK